MKYILCLIIGLILVGCGDKSGSNQIETPDGPVVIITPPQIEPPAVITEPVSDNSDSDPYVEPDQDSVGPIAVLPDGSIVPADDLDDDQDQNQGPSEVKDCSNKGKGKNKGKGRGEGQNCSKVKHHSEN